jgi:Glycosyl hydrolases family 16
MRLLILLLIFLLPNLCEARGGGGTPPTCTAATPAAATAVGYTNLVFCDTFATNQKIDVNNTQFPGYNWYVTDYLPGQGGTLNPNQIFNDGTGNYLVLSGSSPFGIYSATGNGSNTGYVGNAWGGGFYAEIQMKWNSTTGYCTTRWPVFWFRSTDVFSNNVYPQEEIDVFEFDACGGPQVNIYDFSATSIGYGNSNNGPSIGSPDFTQYHTYGVLWVTAANNGGTGYVSFYFDGTLTNTVQYSQNSPPNPSTCRNPFGGSVTCPNGTFYNFDSRKFFAILNTVNPGTAQYTAVFKNMHVWQLPASR